MSPIFGCILAAVLLLAGQAGVKAALGHDEVATTLGSWMDGERLAQIAGFAEESRERKKKRGL